MPMPAMPTIRLDKTIPNQTDVLVIGLTGGDVPTLVGAGDDLEKAGAARFGQPLVELATSLGAKARAGTTATLPAIDGTRLVVVGLGEGEPDPERLRRAAGVGLRAAAGLAGKEPLRVAVALEADDPETVQGVAEGALLGAHTQAKVTKEEQPAKVAEITVVSGNVGPETTAACETASVVARHVCLARDWINLPANLLYPESFADDAKAVARDVRIDVEVLDERELERKGYGGIMAVGKGSARKPRLVRYSYEPKGATAHLALVGKGITFDSGGLDIKPADGMYTMKCDMSGAAAVLAATRAIAELGLAVKVTCYAAMAENMPSGEAYRPSDVLTMYGGKTVENANTDAEGRLVMADALARATEDGPDMIVDVATLTGACVVALGERVAGLMASDDDTADAVLDAAESAGEAFWQLPIPEGTREKLESKIADIKSSGSRMGGALAAAAFLQEFVGDDIAWAHLDIAGPAFNTESPYGYVGVGGSGVAVRTLVALARSLQH